MSSLRKCQKDGIELSEEFFCSGCIFHIRNPFKGMFFYDCEYYLWNDSELKQTKKEDTDV